MISVRDLALSAWSSTSCVAPQSHTLHAAVRPTYSSLAGWKGWTPVKCCHAATARMSGK